MKPTTRQILLGLALVITIAAAWFAPPQSADVVSAVAPSSRPGNAVLSGGARGAGTADSVRVLPIRSRAADEDLSPAFAAHSWAPPPKKAEPVPAAPPAPVAPPLPFKFMGRYVENGHVTVFLLEGERNHVARVGDLIDGIYRVDDITGTTMTFIYLPLEQKQTLAVGESN